MEHTRFIGLDIHKERISVAVAQSGRSGAVEYLGEIINEPGAISKLCDRLRRSGKPLAFCYEAGPCGYDHDNDHGQGNGSEAALHTQWPGGPGSGVPGAGQCRGALVSTMSL